VDEFWVCQHCRSLNRSGTSRCYHCREKFGSRPKEAPQVVRNVGAPGPAPYSPGTIGSVGGFGGPIGTGAGGAMGSALGGPPVGDPPAYLSRPVALGPTPVRDFSAMTTPARTESRFRLPSPTGWIGRRISRSLAGRQSVSVSAVGYVSAALLTIMLIGGALMVATLIPVARSALQSGSISVAWNQTDNGHRMAMEAMTVAFAVIGLVALIVFSIFIGLATFNAPGLGAEMPLLTPGRAGTSWLGVLWAQARIAVGVLVPTALLWLGYPLLGLIAALVAVEVAQRRMNDPFGWLIDPSNHLPGLYAKFGVSGSKSSLLGTVWSICFRVANLLAIVVYAVPVLAFTIAAFANASGHMDLLVWPSSGTGPFQLALAGAAALLVLTTAGSIGLLVPISIDLVDRQRTRKTMARVSKSRPWTGSPGNYSAPTPGAGATRWDSYAEPKVQEPDQASLYSPSTTSSFPWEEEVSGDSPPD
jgi:hypothetical protein